jgi:TolB-like protein/tetratricopeptide (TPR) repeat protein
VNGAPAAAVTGAAEQAPAAAPAPAERGPARPRRGTRRRVAIALAIAAIALALGALRARRAPGPGRITSIAVLPLKNLSGDPGKDYFADGTTEALITELGKIGALQVRSYQSVARHRGTSTPLREIARELRVDALLVGAVLQTGRRVRLTANLYQPSPERQLWSEMYEFDVRDVLAIEGELARDMASRIRVTVTAPEQARLGSDRRVDPEAYEAYLLGRAHLSKTPTAESFENAKAYFEQAIAHDPGFAPAYASLGHLYMHHRGLAPSSDEARRAARRWGERAAQLDDTLAEAHAVIARSAQQDWDFAGAEREFRRAIELNPGDPVTRIWYVLYLEGMQRTGEASAQARRAQQLDPVSPFVNTWAAAAAFYAGDVDEAIATARKALELDPSYADASLVLARTLVTLGRYGEAIAELERALTLNRQPHLLGALGHAFARAGRRDDALKVVAELSGTPSDERGYTQFGLIWAYAGLEDRDRAFAALEKAYDARLGRMVWLQVDPLLDPLRSDPRLSDLARRVGLPPTLPPLPRRPEPRGGPGAPSSP